MEAAMNSSAVTPADVVRAIRTCFARFPQVKQVLAVLEELFASHSEGDLPEHLLLLGDTGVGKSTLLEYMRDSHPRVVHETFTEVPVLYVPVPPACNINKLAGAMLRALGSPFWNKGDAEDRTHQLVVLLQSCKVRLILLDEVNHLVDRGAQKTHHSVGDWIKTLSDTARVPFVMAGIPRASKLLDVNDQLRGRFKRLTLRPFSYEDKPRQKEFRSALRTFGGLITGIDCSELSEEDMAKLVVFATHGRLRAIRELLIAAARLAFAEKATKLSRDLLERAFRLAIFEDAEETRNPFSLKFNGVPLIKAGEPYAPAELP